LIEGGLIFRLAPIRVAIHTFTQNIHVFVVVYNFTLVVTGEASPGRWAAGMACGTNAIGAIMVDREGMAEIGWQPTAGGMTGGTLTIKMIGRSLVDMA